MSLHHRRPANRRGHAVRRKRAIAKAGRRCQRCGRPGRLMARRLEAHHPIPLSAGGAPDQPLEVVCRECHFVEYNKTDPARVAWRSFVRELAAC